MFYFVPSLCQIRSINDFSDAQIVLHENSSKQEQAAVKLLTEEVEKRTLIKIPSSVQWPASSNPVIAVGTLASFKKDEGLFGKNILQASSENKPEGFRL